MLAFKLKKGIIHIGVIVLALVGLTVLSSVTIFGKPDLNDPLRGIDREALRSRICQMFPGGKACGESLTGGLPFPSEEIAKAYRECLRQERDDDKSAGKCREKYFPASLYHKGKCEITSPAPTPVTGLEGAGINQVIRLKPGGIFTFNVTGVKPYNPNPPGGANIPSYKISTYHWRTLLPTGSSHGLGWNSSSFNADANGSYTGQSAITDYSWFNEIGPAPVGTGRGLLADKKFMVPIYRLYLLNQNDQVEAGCGFLLVDKTAPGDTIQTQRGNTNR